MDSSFVHTKHQSKGFDGTHTGSKISTSIQKYKGYHTFSTGREDALSSIHPRGLGSSPQLEPSPSVLYSWRFRRSFVRFLVYRYFWSLLFTIVKMRMKQFERRQLLHEIEREGRNEDAVAKISSVRPPYIIHQGATTSSRM